MATSHEATASSGANRRARPGAKDRSSEHRRNAELWKAFDELRQAQQEAEASGDPLQAARLAAAAKQARDEFILANQALVITNAQPFLIGSTSDREDILQAGMTGLIEAVDGYNPSKGKFATWAHRHINGRIMREVRKAEHTTMSYGDWSARRSVLNARAALELELGRAPTYPEIAERCGQTATLVERVLRPRPESLDRPVGEDGDATIGDLHGVDRTRVQPMLGEAAVRDMVAAAAAERQAEEAQFAAEIARQRTEAEAIADAEERTNRLKALEAAQAAVNKDTGPLARFAEALRSGEIDEHTGLTILARATADISALDLLLVLRRRGLDGAEPETLIELSSLLGIGREILRRREDRVTSTLDRKLAELMPAV